jgi:signal transduction histidine kinase
VLNAFQHAQAAHVEVDLDYQHDALHLRVRDDGVGLPEAVLRAGGRQGHWGLYGIRERAQRIGGTLTLTSAEGAGTTVSLRVPASVAYRAPLQRASRWQRWWRWLRRG